VQKILLFKLQFFTALLHLVCDLLNIILADFDEV